MYPFPRITIGDGSGLSFTMYHGPEKIISSFESNIIGADIFINGNAKLLPL